ncbi:glutaredoxin family protein [Aeromonas hydrophila]|uniref:glutaredoxin family protein n=1 Tax=Aeromonas hydrophila TaxID=644 RepID=UPI002B48DD5B|nr:glutaredoxin family protein [Aeromonas hydrophila]
MLTLFHTDGCHLCEQAWALVEQADLAADTRQCDIMDDERWLATYRVRIPVLRDEAGRELGWPFTLAELQAWLARQG